MPAAKIGNIFGFERSGLGGLKYWRASVSIHSQSHILLVDDSSTVRKVVRELLEQLRFKNIDEASDGEAALAKIGEKRYDLVIADWNMEPMNGQMLLERIREDKTHKNLRFIMMTAEAAIEKIIQANHARVSGFINKPFTAEALRIKIAQIG
jgi:two-component system chemotaxis response regulator CheY